MDETELRMWAMSLAVEAGAEPGSVVRWAELYLGYLFPEPHRDPTGAVVNSDG